MKTVIIVIVTAALVAVAVFFGCNTEKREKLLTAISETVRPEESGESTPDVVAKQQRRESIRQNRVWTPENQAKYPVEYCQAQLEKLDEYAAMLEANIHRVNMAVSDCRRKIDECTRRSEVLKTFLEMAKAKYRAAEAKNAFPVEFNGYSLSKTQAQEKIVQASRQLPEIRKQLMASRNLLGQLEKKKSAIAAEQTRLTALRERVRNTINDLRTKKVIEGNKNIVDVLNSLGDSIDSLGKSGDGPALEDIITPTAESATRAEFDAIMGADR